MTVPAFIELDRRGLEYVQEHLTGVNALCTALLAVVQNEPGKVFTLAPFGAPPDRLHRFTEGGLLESNRLMLELDESGALAPVDSLKIEQGAYLLSMLRAKPEAVCIIDDFEPRWSEPPAWLSPRAFGVEDDVYHLLEATDAPQDFVEALQAGDTIWHGVAAICAQAPELDAERNCSVDSLQAAALSVLALTCTAFDGEGFVVWRRS